MSIRDLKKIVPPPVKPVEVGTLAEWANIEQQLGTQLPADYREFVFAYGSGLFARFYRVYNPFARSKYIALLSQTKLVCDLNRVSQQSFPKRFPYPYYPEAGGLLPWGNDENGNDYFWLTKGSPNKWVVVQDENRGAGIHVHNHSMTAFLVAILERQIEALAGEYPTQTDHTFQPWDSGAKK